METTLATLDARFCAVSEAHEILEHAHSEAFQAFRQLHPIYDYREYHDQLAALRTRDDAEMQWRTFQSKAPGLASSARMDIQRADLGAQGIYFRLRAGFFDTRERASAYCDKAKAQGQDCMVVVR